MTTSATTLAGSFNNTRKIQQLDSCTIVFQYTRNGLDESVKGMAILERNKLTVSVVNSYAAASETVWVHLLRSVD